MGFMRWQWYYNKKQHTKIHISHKITHRTQTKHSTQSYTNNERHLNTTQKKKLSLYQAVEAYEVVRCRGEKEASVAKNRRERLVIHRKTRYKDDLRVNRMYFILKPMSLLRFKASDC
jgi:hypothetical protein